MITPKPPSKREIVRTHLMDELSSGKYAVGQAFVAEQELAKTLGICKNTVREAYSSLVTDGLLVRRRGAGTFVRQLSAGGRLVSVVTGDPRGQVEPFTAAILAGLHAEMDDGYSIKTCSMVRDRTEESLRAYLEQSRPGDVVVVAGAIMDGGIIEPLLDAGRKVMAIGRPSTASRVPYVHTDHAAGIRIAVEYLLARGKRRIALVDRAASHPASYLERRDSFLDALAAAGLRPDVEDFVECFHHDYALVLTAARRLLRRNPEVDAVVAYGDVTTEAFRDVIRDAGHKAEVLGYFGDSTGKKPMPGIATVNWSVSGLARLAARRIHEQRFEGGELLPARLYPPETGAAPR